MNARPASPRRFRGLSSTVICAVWLPLSSCGGDAGNAVSPDAGGTGPDGGAPSTPAYLVATCVYSPDSSNGYVVALDSLDSGSAPELDDALEIPGCGVISGPEGQGVFFVGSGESPTIQRYRWSDGGFAEDGAPLSLAGLGITDTSYQQGQFVYLAPDKAYIISGKGAPEIIVWNPQAMEIVKTVPIEGLERDGTYPAFGYTPHVIGSRLYISARWRSEEAIRQENALVVADTETDSILNVATDDRCGDLLYSGMDVAGNIYFSNGQYASAFRLAVGEDAAPPPCVLRVRPGEASFDPDFRQSLSDLVGGREASSITPGPVGTAFVQVFDEDVSPVAPGTEWFELFDAPGWRWWRVDLGFDGAKELTELPHGAAAFDPFPVSDRVYQTLPTEFYTETTFLDMTASGGVPAMGRVVPGYVTGVVRVR